MSEPQPASHYDVCVIGAGIAGLNAVHVASRYLGRGGRIALVDRHERVGGMWVDTYGYVRLHQPHPYFTAGDVRWDQGHERGYLATREEVLDHLRHCLDEARRRVEVVELLGHEMEAVDEDGDLVRVTCRTADDRAVLLTADRVVNACALDIDVNPPLDLSSTQVRSVSPNTCDVRSGSIAEDDAPVWVVGSGKTGMDTAYGLITAQPGRKVHMVAGSGTFFSLREQVFPSGAARWWGSTLPNAFFAGMADRFDGTNEGEVLAWVRETNGTSITPRADSYFLGLASRHECDVVRAGLGQVVMGHLADIIDTAAGPRMVLREGEEIEVEPGSWVVNCTGYLVHRDRIVSVPYVSPGGRVVTVGGSSLFGFSSFTSYFLTHLLMLGKIREVPLYQLDVNELFRAKSAAVATIMTLAQYNLGLTFDAVPSRVFRQFGLDFDRWYPLHRRLAGQVAFMVLHKRKRAQYRHALDTVVERFGLEGGPVVGARATART